MNVAGCANRGLSDELNCFDLGRGIGHSAFGIRHSAFGIWHLAFGIWHLAFGIWHLAFGIWHLALTSVSQP
jgi:hypothetical protein